MARILLVLLTASLALSGLVTAEDPIPVNGHLGSDLLLPLDEACTHSGSYHFDLFRGTEMMGTYHGELQGRYNYQDRLLYNVTTCAITLTRLRTEDGTTFSVRLSLNINNKPTPHDIEYQVTIRDPLTSQPTTRPTPQTQDERISRNGLQVTNSGFLRFISFCLSLDTLVNIGFGSCQKLDERSVNVACRISYFITVITRICSIGTMLSEYSLSWIVVSIAIIFIADLAISLGYEPSPRCKRIAPNLCHGFLMLIHVLSPVLTGVFYFGSGDFSGKEASRTGFLVLSIFVSTLLRIVVFGIIFCCYKAKFNEVPTEDPKRTTNDPEIVASM